MKLSQQLEVAMSHVSLDSQPEAVRQFVMALEITPEGTNLELDGRVVARVLPPTSTDGAEDWNDEKNHRRCDLINKKYKSGLSEAEHAELDHLQMQMYRHRDTVAPLPMEFAEQLLKELQQKAASAKSA